MDHKNKFEWNSTYDNELPPAELEREVIVKLRAKGLIATKVSGGRWLRIAAGLLLAAVSFGMGYFVSSSGRNDAGTGQRYALLLYRTSDFEPDSSRFEEYGRWLRSIEQDGVIASGEALQQKGWWLPNHQQHEAISSDESGKVISGFFIIQTASEEQALQIAQACPHLKYNGQIELRPIYQPDNQ